MHIVRLLPSACVILLARGHSPLGYPRPRHPRPRLRLADHLTTSILLS
jgi:hypothetical protein